jgi:hypothetical protein
MTNNIDIKISVEHVFAIVHEYFYYRRGRGRDISKIVISYMQYRLHNISLDNNCDTIRKDSKMSYQNVLIYKTVNVVSRNNTLF